MPKDFNWATKHYPAFNIDRKVEFADIGCGYGGLLFSLSPIFPDKLILGMEIRVKVEEFVNEKIEVMRSKAETDIVGKGGIAVPGAYQNISVMRMNAQKYWYLESILQQSKLF